MKKGSIVRLPIDGCFGIIVNVIDRLWGGEYAIIPLQNSTFYEGGKVEMVLQSQIKS